MLNLNRSLALTVLCFTSLFTSFSLAQECDKIVRVGYVVEAVAGSRDSDQNAKKMIIEHYGKAYWERLVSDLPASEPTDIFSTNPELDINFARLVDGTYNYVYLRGSRFDVLSHLLVIKQREAKNRNKELVDYLASEPIDDIQNFILKFPYTTGPDVDGIPDLLNKVKTRRAEFAADAALGQFKTLVTLRVTFTDTSPAHPAQPRRFRLLWSIPEPIPLTKIQVMTTYFKSMGLAHEVSADGQTVTLQLMTTYFSTIEELYRTVDLAYRSGLLPSILPLFEQKIAELNLAYPPGAQIRKYQEKRLQEAKNGLPADPAY